MHHFQEILGKAACNISVMRWLTCKSSNVLVAASSCHSLGAGAISAARGRLAGFRLAFSGRWVVSSQIPQAQAATSSRALISQPRVKATIRMTTPARIPTPCHMGDSFFMRYRSFLKCTKRKPHHMTGHPVHMVRLWAGRQKLYCLCRVCLFTSFLPGGKNIYIKSASRIPAPRGAKLLLALVYKNNCV